MMLVPSVIRRTTLRFKGGKILFGYSGAYKMELSSDGEWLENLEKFSAGGKVNVRFWGTGFDFSGDHVAVLFSGAEDVLEGAEAAEVHAVAMGQVLSDPVENKFENPFGFSVVADEFFGNGGRVGLVIHFFFASSRSSSL